MTHALPVFDVPALESDDAGPGALQTERGCLPLVSLEVRSHISGLLAHTSVRQTFCNAFDEPLEATYIFPLPDRAAVIRFRMTAAGRVVEGELKERAQAREEYDAAIQQGHRAAIAEEERSGVFTMRVGNLPPREEATIELDLVGPLEMTDDEATYRFPLVVAPRYTPGVALEGPSVGDGVAADTDQVPDASRVTPPVLLPGFPNPVRLSLEVELDPAGLEAGLSGVRASLHSVVVAEQGPPWTVRLQPGERLNRDFILRFPVAGRQVQTTLQCSPAAKDRPGVFALTLTPPAMETIAPRPREVVFVLDRSGSMSGWKMVAARRALGRMIDTLLDQDRFTVIAFDDRQEQPAKTLLTGANRDRWRVLEWLGKIDARGGTEMGPALRAALKCFSPADQRLDRVLVVVTDGQVSGEDGLLRTLKKEAGGALPRVFTLGIDQAVNAGFLRRLADLGGGVCDLVESEDRLDEALDGVHRLIGQPVLTDVRLELVDFDGVAESLAPARIAGLYAGRPLMIFGRHLSDKTNVHLRVHAVDASGKPWSADVAARSGPAEMLLNLWGRAKVREMEDRYAAEGMRDSKLADRIVKVSLETNVLCRFTAYVAVDKSEVVNQGDQQQKVIQPVELPAGWDAEAARSVAAYAASAHFAMLSMPFSGGRRMSRHKMRAENAAPPPPHSVTVDSFLQDFDLADDLMVGPAELSPSAAHPSPFADLEGKLLGLLAGLQKKSHVRTTLNAVIAELQRTIAAWKSAGGAPALEALAGLIATLRTLAIVLAQQNQAVKDQVEDLANEGDEVLASWDAAADANAVATRLGPYLDAVTQLLANLTATPKKRGAFWKTGGKSQE